MRVGVLGTGDVGRTLGGAFAALGHEVMLGARAPGHPKAAAWARETTQKAGTFAEAAAFGELVVLATLGVATEEIVRGVGVGAFSGKPVLDATNPLDLSGGAPDLALGHTDSLGERIQRLLPGAHVVKCFNTVGHAHMFRPRFSGGPPDMFICGDDAGAKARVAEILGAFGWGTVDIGGIDGSRYLEPMCMAWVRYGMGSGTWDHAFKLLREREDKA